MKREILALGFLTFSIAAFAQSNRQHRPVDTLRIQEIEDIKLHKTGNPE